MHDIQDDHNSSGGQKHTYMCGGASDQEALIYAGTVVEAKADRSDPEATVEIMRDDKEIGPAATVGELTPRAVLDAFGVAPHGIPIMQSS